jgi:Zn-dependent protease
MDFSSWFPYPLSQLPFFLIGVLVAFTVHEFAHAYVAYRFGDPTAKREGRLTLNPAVHLDPIGTLLIVFTGFGWAKPVPVNRHYFRHPRIAGPLVSLAGPLSNLILSFVFMFIWYLLFYHNLLDGLSERPFTLLDQFLSTMIHLNLILFFLNLLPLPPLDGYRIIEDLIPNRTRVKLAQFEPYGTLLLFIMLSLPQLRSMVIDPYFNYFLTKTIDWFKQIIFLFL